MDSTLEDRKDKLISSKLTKLDSKFHLSENFEFEMNCLHHSRRLSGLLLVRQVHIEARLASLGVELPPTPPEPKGSFFPRVIG